MNNEQFRRLVLDNPKPTSSSTAKATATPTPARKDGGATPGPGAVLGSRMRSSIPMTPRSVKGVDFARQLAEHRREQQRPPTKKFRSYDPKGSKLASGYQDRAQLRRELEEQEKEDDVQDKEKRVKALEEMVKLGQIDQATFEKLRAEIGVGGDVRTAPLVKGLDWELLRRVKAGEDVTKPVEKPSVPEEEKVEDADEEFDRVLEEKEKEEVAPVAPKEKKVKKGNMAPPPPPPVPSSQTKEAGQQKRSRDDILRQLKEGRARAAAGAGAAPAPAAAPAPEPPASTLGSKFKKIGDPKNEKKRWIEQDETGRRREVLITTDAEGKMKRKVRWLDPPKPAEKTNGNNNGLLMPDKDAKPLGMEVPAEFVSKAASAAAVAQEEDEDDDIFAGVGADYNPLADIADDDASSSEEEGEAKADKAAVSEKNAEDRDLANIEKKEKEPAAPSQPPKPRNYFTTSTTTEAPELDRSNPLTTDPTILEALKRAAKLRQASPSAELAEEAAEDEDVDPETLLRRKKFLEEARRREVLDNMDMDLGFGSSRIEDEEDDEYIEARGGQKRKRGPKKRKGDKENVADVMRVLERRKGEGEGKGKEKA
ncbi:hypothetical protein VTN00DRAFT_4764 [Thermoascus crustaceus]|uniref:uncharacterized protein n=1 Tax=Thermoascus crustaceus TaxID=5088 RepID=UPI0037427BFA